MNQIDYEKMIEEAMDKLNVEEKDYILTNAKDVYKKIIKIPEENFAEGFYKLITNLCGIMYVTGKICGETSTIQTTKQ